MLCLVAQWCLTLCSPVDCSPPDSSVHAILQARTLVWVAIPSSGDLPDPGIKPGSPALQAESLLSEPPGKLHKEETDSQLWGLIPGIAICLSGSRKKKKNCPCPLLLSHAYPLTLKAPSSCIPALTVTDARLHTPCHHTQCPHKPRPLQY